MSTDPDPVPSTPRSIFIDYNLMLAQLLVSDVVKLSSASNSELLVVPHKDLHYEGVVGYEPLNIEDLDLLYNFWKADPELGSTFWCFYRNWTSNERLSESMKERLIKNQWSVKPSDWRSGAFTKRTAEFFRFVNDSSE